ncbi:MAG: ABC transporter substrate-binding protein [Alphaproteobacteria bacterium]|nr:ABC transporter substrate-binding protein [Alphaproteobacteria bacterium]
MKRPKPAARNATTRRVLLAALAAAPLVSRTARADGPVSDIRIGYLRWTERRPTISLLDQPAPDNGLAGAKVALTDNNTTGRFLNQHYDLIDVPLRDGDDPVAALNTLVGQGVTLVLADLPADQLMKLSDAGRDKDVTLFNIAAPDDVLRGKECRSNLINVAPSRAMLADALAQYLVWKKWPRWFLIYGSHPDDAALADAYRRAAKRFGARIVEERVFKDTGESRQTDSGLVQTQQQMPLFTRGAPDYDVLIAADENQVFAGYLPYRTWAPRPVAGSAGLKPVTWDPSSESWGGTQLQSRFNRLFRRTMTQLDMQAWTAVRMIGEAAARSKNADPKAIMAYMKSPAFGVAAYKGRELSLRPWDWQLRQPILLSDGRLVVSISPQPGFLHQVTELDTLGFDRPETTCKFR